MTKIAMPKNQGRPPKSRGRRIVTRLLLGLLGLLLLLVVFVARAVDGLTGGNVSVANAYLADVTDEEMQERMKREIPLRRFAEPEEVAAAVCFLASPAAAYVNGINLPVDGGRTLSL